MHLNPTATALTAHTKSRLLETMVHSPLPLNFIIILLCLLHPPLSSSSAPLEALSVGDMTCRRLRFGSRISDSLLLIMDRLLLRKRPPKSNPEVAVTFMTLSLHPSSPLRRWCASLSFDAGEGSVLPLSPCVHAALRTNLGWRLEIRGKRSDPLLVSLTNYWMCHRGSRSVLRDVTLLNCPLSLNLTRITARNLQALQQSIFMTEALYTAGSKTLRHHWKPRMFFSISISFQFKCNIP